MNDMTAAIVPKSDQLNADDLIAGEMTITIREVRIKGGQEQPVSIYYGDSDKPYKPCKSMSRVLVALWGPDAKVYTGRSLTLYRDPTVKWAGMDVGGIRISHMSHIESAHTMALTATKGSRKPFKVLPLETPKPTTVAEPSAALIEAGMSAAKQGTAALTAWWKALSADDKKAMKATLDNDLKPLAASSDPASDQP